MTTGFSAAEVTFFRCIVVITLHMCNYVFSHNLHLPKTTPPSLPPPEKRKKKKPKRNPVSAGVFSEDDTLSVCVFRAMELSDI